MKKLSIIITAMLMLSVWARINPTEAWHAFLAQKINNSSYKYGAEHHDINGKSVERHDSAGGPVTTHNNGPVTHNNQGDNSGGIDGGEASHK